MARSAVDCGAILGAIAGADPKDPTAVLESVPGYLTNLNGNLRGTRIGVDRRLDQRGRRCHGGEGFQDALRIASPEIHGRRRSVPARHRMAPPPSHALTI